MANPQLVRRIGESLGYLVVLSAALCLVAIAFALTWRVVTWLV